MQIHPLLARSDNWMYLVVDEASNEAAVVDPYDWKKMLGLVKEKGVNVSVKQGMTEREGADRERGMAGCRSRP